MKILEEFWFGNIEPTEYDTSSCKEYGVQRSASTNSPERRKASGHYDG